MKRFYHADGGTFKPVLADADNSHVKYLQDELRELQPSSCPTSDALDMLPGLVQVGREHEVRHHGVAHVEVTGRCHVRITFLGPATKIGNGPGRQMAARNAKSPALALLIEAPVGTSVTIRHFVLETYDASQYYE